MDPHIKSRGLLWILIVVYVVFNFSLRLFLSSFLYLKRVRVIPALADVVFISLIILNSTDSANSWFLFYVFPIIEVSRYFGWRGILTMSLCALGTYSIVYLISGETRAIDPRWFVMRCLVLLGIGAVCVNLARTRHKELLKLIDVHEQITHAILSGSKLDQILNFVLGKGLEFTNSEMGHIRVMNQDTGEYEVATSIGDSRNSGWGWSQLANDLAKKAVSTKESIRIAQIDKGRWKDLGAYFKPQFKPQSAVFVPLGSRENVIAVIAAYSDWSFHYGKIDVRRLKAFAPLIEMALKTDELSEAESYYRELIENAPDPIIVLDKTGNIVVFNKACEDLWGFTKEAVAERPEVGNYYKSEKHAREIGKMLWKSTDHRIENFEAWIKAKNGEIIPISLSACQIVNEGKRDRSIGVFKDRRQAIEMEEKVLQAERLAMVGALAGTVGHDIKHKIGTALNYLDTLLYNCDPERDAELHRIYANMNRVLHEAVGEFNKLLTAHRPGLPQMKEVMVGEIFHAVEERMQQRALDKNIRFVVNYPEPDIMVSVDLEQMIRVLSNLFTNSLHAIERRRTTDAPSSEGLIELAASFNQSQVKFTWRDNGCGVSEEDSKNIFNAFVTTKGDKGTGLGLFIVRSIIQNHEGRVELESRLGEGAAFNIMLPIPPPGFPDADLVAT